jgi:hypothetical protein
MRAGPPRAPVLAARYARGWLAATACFQADRGVRVLVSYVCDAQSSKSIHDRYGRPVARDIPISHVRLLE